MRNHVLQSKRIKGKIFLKGRLKVSPRARPSPTPWSNGPNKIDSRLAVFFSFALYSYIFLLVNPT